MAEYLIQDTTLTSIADAIREKTGKTGKISIANFANNIVQIPTSSSDETAPAQYENIGAAFEGYDTESITRLRISKDGTKIYGYLRNQLLVFDATSFPAKLLSAYPLENISTSASVIGCFVSPDCTRCLVSYGASPYFRVYDISTGSFNLIFELTSNPMTNSNKLINNVVWSQDMQLLCIGFASGHAFYRWENDTYVLKYAKPYSKYCYAYIGFLCDERLFYASSPTAPYLTFYTYQEGEMTPVTIPDFPSKWKTLSRISVKGDHLAALGYIEGKELHTVTEFVFDPDQLTARELYTTKLSDAQGFLAHFHHSDHLLIALNTGGRLRRFQVFEDGGYRDVPLGVDALSSAAYGITIMPDDEHIICDARYDENLKCQVLRKKQ